MGADLDHGPAEEVNEETDDADVNARLGNEGTAAIDAMDELQSSVATMETIYEIQEVRLESLTGGRSQCQRFFSLSFTSLQVPRDAV